jgi:hypothetical protein
MEEIMAMVYQEKCKKKKISNKSRFRMVKRKIYWKILSMRIKVRRKLKKFDVSTENIN